MFTVIDKVVSRNTYHNQSTNLTLRGQADTVKKACNL